MNASSGIYNFASIKAELLIREAFELVGIPGSLVTSEQLEGAARSINFLLSDLVNKNVNLWTIKTIVQKLTTGQISYTLPAELIKVVQVNLKTSYRDFNGTAFSSEGTSNNAFDSDSLTSCLQTNPNGSIGYNFNPTSKTISFCGVRSMTTQNYTLVIEASNLGGVDVNWTTILTIPVQSYIANTTSWFDLNNTTDYLYYRIRETGNAILNINELYFNDQVVDTALSEITLYSYFKMPIKSNVGRPTIYSVDYQIIPQINIWQSPSEEYNYISISYQAMIESLETYTESINIPTAFYQAVVYGLAKSLAMKYAPDKLQFIAPEFDRALQSCITNNTNNLPLTFKPYVN